MNLTIFLLITLFQIIYSLKYPATNVFDKDTPMTVSVFTRDVWPLEKSTSKLIAQLNFTYGDWSESHEPFVANISYARYRNSQLWLHAVAHLRNEDPFTSEKISENWISLFEKRKRFIDPTRYLLTDPIPEKLDDKFINEKVYHAKTLMTISLLDDFQTYLNSQEMPAVARQYYESPRRKAHSSLGERKFLPVLFLNDFYNYKEDFVLLNKTQNDFKLTVNFAPQTMVRFQWMRELNAAFRKGNPVMGDEDGDDMRRMFLDTHPYLLYATSIVSILHILFDFLAFKNDIAFWKSRDSFEGLSLGYVLCNALMQVIVVLYLANENTSKLVLIPASIGTFVELWKVTKAFTVSIKAEEKDSDDDSDKEKKLSKPWYKRIEFSAKRSKDSETAKYDQMAWRSLGPFLIVGVLIYAIYGLVFVKQRGWYSWFIRSAVGLVYGGGFILMTPQLFINYRLKSVAHLPWRVFGYKAMNTFIDDLFAFVIKMPSMHRAACFRDDIVFLIYMYQRWVYRVDRKRMNEYGQSFDDSEEKKNIDDDDNSEQSIQEKKQQ